MAAINEMPLIPTLPVGAALVRPGWSVVSGAANKEQTSANVVLSFFLIG